MGTDSKKKKKINENKEHKTRSHTLAGKRESTLQWVQATR
jgi:hypothetical protein